MRLKNLTEKTMPIYEGAIRIASKKYQLTGDELHLHEAFRFSEKSKAFLLRKAIQRERVFQFANVSDSIRDIEYQMKVELSFF